MKIALVGNPNSGKTTLFNELTGSNQFVGNWPGVTVERKEGKLKGKPEVVVVDLPGIYSLSPYSPEEVIARNYLIEQKPDVIINIVDGSNLERNLYLSTQIMELGIPVVMAVNMMDVVQNRGDVIRTERLAKFLGCKVVEISALRANGIDLLIQTVLETAKNPYSEHKYQFSEVVEQTLQKIEKEVLQDFPSSEKRFWALKIFERDRSLLTKVGLSEARLTSLEEQIKNCELQFSDDSESIITTERYNYIDEIVKECRQLKQIGALTTSDKIDKMVTNRFLALPIFVLVMFLVYYVSVSSLGSIATDWANEGVFGDGWHFMMIGAAEYDEAFSLYEEEVEIAVKEYGEEAAEQIEEPDPAEFGVWVIGVPVIIEGFLESINCADWLSALILDGVIAGVGAVLGFVPQMFILFAFLAFLESCGYMARIAFIMDRAFRRFGLSGKSFIPILIGTGCGVPGIMAARTIENEQDRRMTIMTTTFIPCGAKLPIIALIAGAMFDGQTWVAPSAYFIGMGAIIFSGILLKKTPLFAGETTPFVMELPPYHMPTIGRILRSMWERGWSFIQKAGTIVLLATILVWFTSSYGWVDGGLTNVEMDDSFLAGMGNAFAWIFAPLGWGSWQAAVAAITGLIAKENVVGTFGILYGYAEVAEDGIEIWHSLADSFTPLTAYSFLVFNLLCAPCFAAIGAIRREMNNSKWFWTAIGYQCGLAYLVSLWIYQLGDVLVFGNAFSIGTIIATVTLIIFLIFLLKPAGKKAMNLTHD